MLFAVNSTYFLRKGIIESSKASSEGSTTFGGSVAAVERTLFGGGGSSIDGFPRRGIPETIRVVLKVVLKVNVDAIPKMTRTR